MSDDGEDYLGFPGERRDWVLHQLRRLWVELEEQQMDIETVAHALKVKLVSVDEAVGLLWSKEILQQLGDDENAKRTEWEEMWRRPLEETNPDFKE